MAERNGVNAVVDIAWTYVQLIICNETEEKKHTDTDRHSHRHGHRHIQT